MNENQYIKSKLRASRDYSDVVIIITCHLYSAAKCKKRLAEYTGYIHSMYIQDIHRRDKFPV